ncbi:MAG: zf-HC2 domain-containing protein [Pseudomonadota bacterium]
MTALEFRCPKGREVSDLPAYVEGDLDASAREVLEEHLKLCRACSEEVASLRRMILLLRGRPESLHPDEVELHNFVSHGEDPAGRIAAHLAWCEDCREDIRMLEEMLSVSGGTQADRNVMPQALVDGLKEVYPSRERAGLPTPLSALLKGLLSQPFRAPVLALGTAAALLVIAVVSVPMWRTYKDTAVPLLTLPDRDAVHTDVAPAPREPQEKLFSDARGRKPAPVEGMSVPRENLEKSLVDGLRTRAEAVKEKKSEYTIAAEDRRKPAPVEAGIVKREIAAPKAPAAIVPSSGRDRSAVEKISSEMRRETKMTKKPALRHPDAVSRGIVRPNEFSARESAPEVHGVGRLKAMKRPPADPRPSRIDTGTAVRGGSLKGPVTIRVVDHTGRSIPWLRLEPPAEPADGVRFEEAEETSDDVGPTPRSLPGAGEPQPLKERDAEGPLVLIRVDTSKDLYDVGAELFEPGSNRAVKTIEAFGIRRSDIEKRIQAIVSSILKRP